MANTNDELEKLITRIKPNEDEERDACVDIKPGFHLRPPPLPQDLDPFLTSDDDLFQTIHMGSTLVDVHKWQLVVDGLVKFPFTCSYSQLQQFPRSTVTSFHECYGSPLKPPTTPLWRVGNVTWTGVLLKTLLDLAQPLHEARYVWSDGLDHGNFAGKYMDRYQKDLPLHKACGPEVLLAYELNGKSLGRERGGPVRLIVPGWFGTNSTKWICKLSLQRDRSPSPFTTIWYNETDPTDPEGRQRPVWMVEPNSMIVSPPADAELKSSRVPVKGWAWSNEGINDVEVSTDEGQSWLEASVEPRIDFSWQSFTVALELPRGRHSLIARATSSNGTRQPLIGRRNNAHRVAVNIVY